MLNDLDNHKKSRTTLKYSRMSAREEKNKSLKNCMKGVIEFLKENPSIKDQKADKSPSRNIHSSHYNTALQFSHDEMDRTKSVPSLLQNVDKSIFMHQSTINVRDNVENTENIYKEYKDMLFVE